MPCLVILLLAVSAFAGKRTSRFNSLNAMGDFNALATLLEHSPLPFAEH